VQIPRELADLGTGERNLARILVDYRSRYFLDIDELYDYVLGDTDDIGYVDREKVWVRLPVEFLVLGEQHNLTTVLDLVEATGVKNYIYEGEKARPSPYSTPASRLPKKEYQLEEQLPKAIVGLVGVEKKLAREVHQLDQRPGWKSVIRSDRHTAERADPEAGLRQYQAEMAQWNYEWETKNRSTQERGEWTAEPGAQPSVGQRHPTAGLKTRPPDKPYDRGKVEVRVTLDVLQAVRDMARGKHDPIAVFYAQNRSVIDKTIVQLEDGLPVELTRMFLKMARASSNSTP